MKKILTQKVLLDMLAEAEFGMTRTALLRYVQLGLVLLPKQLSTRENGDRIFYHPLAFIEAMTATLMFKGDFLRPKSDIRMPRFTDTDVFIGRLVFYSQPTFDIPNFDDFLTATDKHKIIAPNSYRINMDDREGLKDFLENCITNYADNIQEVKDAYSVIAKHRDYMGAIYSANFQYLLSRYGFKLEAFIDY